MLKNIFWIFLITVSSTISVKGQSFGGNKWSQKWHQLDNEDFRVIFPTGFESQARSVYSLLDYLNQNARQTIGIKTDKVSLVLNNLTNISNGYVGLAPFRSEFFTTPPQNSFALGSLPWLELLTVHEYRHVLQFSNAKTGLSKVLSVLFGQSAFAGSMNLAIPDWYFEGDAVLAETALTAQGRGRIPHFLRAFKAYEATGRRYSYQKVRNGSFKDFIPDHYRLGYMINKYGADQYGATFWAGVLADAGAYKGLLYPFSRAIKSRSGLTTASLYKATMDHYKSIWLSSKTTLTSGNSLIQNKDKVFTNYRFPNYGKQGQLYYVKGSLNDINTVYTQTNGATKKLFSMGLTNDAYIDINGGKISWAELRFHPSRGNIDYSVAMSYDLNTGEKHQVSFRTRYSSPTSHPDGKIMAVVDINKFGQTQLKIISTRDGLILDSLSNTNNYFITYPKWNKNGSELVFAARDAKGRMALCKQSLDSDEVTALSSWTFYPIGVPHVTDTHIYYSQSAHDAEHIYRISLFDGSRELVVQSQFGAYQPYVSDDQILYSSFTADGLRLMQSSIDPIPADAAPKTFTSDPTYTAYGGNVLNNIPAQSASPKRYGRLNRAINLHSWGLAADDQSASLLVQSDNVLNSVSLSGGVQYLFDDQRSIWTAGASFGFLYPNLTTRFTQEGRTATVRDMDDNPLTVNFNDYSISLGLEAPLNFSSSAYLRSLLPYYAIEKRFFRGDNIRDLNFLSQRIGLIFSNRRLKSPQEILARNSQFLSLNYQGTLDDQEGSQLNFESEFTFRGFMKNHVLRLELDYNYRDGGLFSNRFDEARGYSNIASENAFKLGINYHLPIIYPDFGIAGIAYLKRVQANIFYDYSRLSEAQTTLDLSSTGIELLFDTSLLNTLPVTFGVRYARTIENSDNVIEFFVPFYRF